MAISDIRISLLVLSLALTCQGCANGNRWQKVKFPLDVPAITWPGYSRSFTLTLSIAPDRYRHWEKSLSAELQRSVRSQKAGLRMATSQEQGDLLVDCRIGPVTVTEKWQTITHTYFQANLANRPYQTTTRQRNICWTLPVRLQISDTLLDQVMIQRRTILNITYPAPDAASPLPAVVAAFEKWLADIFARKLQLKTVRLYCHPLVDKQVRPLLAAGDLDGALARLTRTIDFLLVLQNRQSLTEEQWRKLAVAYHTRSVLSGSLQRREPEQRDHRCAHAIWQFLAKNGLGEVPNDHADD